MDDFSKLENRVRQFYKTMSLHILDYSAIKLHFQLSAVLIVASLKEHNASVMRPPSQTRPKTSNFDFHTPPSLRVQWSRFKTQIAILSDISHLAYRLFHTIKKQRQWWGNCTRRKEPKGKNCISEGLFRRSKSMNIYRNQMVSNDEFQNEMVEFKLLRF